jgi:hypothetical protein
MRVRMDVRDAYDKPDSGLQQAAKKLGKEIGLDVNVRIDWPTLWEELKAKYPDNSNFVPSVSRLATTLLVAIQDSIGDDTWGDTLVEKLGDKSSLDIYLVVCHVLLAPGSDPRICLMTEEGAGACYIHARLTLVSIGRQGQDFAHLDLDSAKRHHGSSDSCQEPHLPREYQLDYFGGRVAGHLQEPRTVGGRSGIRVGRSRRRARPDSGQVSRASPQGRNLATPGCFPHTDHTLHVHHQRSS